MAIRGGPTRRMQGPLSGILNDLERRSRATGARRPGKASVEPVEGPRGPRGPAGKVRGAAAVLETGEDGRARWEYPERFEAAPVLTAVPVDPDPGGETTVTVALEDVTDGYAVLRVWATRPLRGSGVVTPAGAGVRVHITACPAPANLASAAGSGPGATSADGG